MNNNIPTEVLNTKPTIKSVPEEPIDIDVFREQFRNRLKPELKQLLDIEMFKQSGENYPKSIDTLETSLTKIIDESDDGSSIFVRLAAMFFVNYPFFTDDGK